MKKLMMVVAIIAAGVLGIMAADFGMKKYFEHLSDEKMKEAMVSMMEGTDYDTLLVYEDENGITHYLMYDLYDEEISLSDDFGNYQISLMK